MAAALSGVTTLYLQLVNTRRQLFFIAFQILDFDNVVQEDRGNSYPKDCSVADIEQMNENAGERCECYRQ